MYEHRRNGPQKRTVPNNRRPPPAPPKDYEKEQKSQSSPVKEPPLKHSVSRFNLPFLDKLNLDTGDIIVAALLFLLYLDSGDDEMLIILLAFLFMP